MTAPDIHAIAARRPKPPPLKEQSLAALEADPKKVVMIMIDVEQFNTISRALESLND
jgi:class 3 adenylate cyclase